MSPRDKGPQVFVKIDRDHGIALVSGPRGKEAVERASVPYRPSRKGKPRGYVIPVDKLPDLESWCQWQGILCIVSPRPKLHVAPPSAPVFVAPEPEPEPEPPAHEQDGLFGDAS